MNWKTHFYEILLHPKKIFIVTLVLSVWAPLAHACRYTVREIGFSQVYSEPYHLYVPLSDDLDDKAVQEAQTIARTALGDANIVPVIARRQNLDSLLTGADHELIIISPQGRSLKHHFSSSLGTWKQDLWEALDWVCFSSVRKKINERLAAYYCVVLYLPGRNQPENELAEKTISAGLTEIEKIMPSMPKPASHPATVIEVKPAEQSRERLLLWSLHADTSLQDGPRAVILYGRARQLGPVLEKEKLNQQNLLNLMALVGADCECGLDRSWILGIMLPCRWGETLQQMVTDDLGFDVENPSVRMEMEQILNINSASAAKSTDFLAGYREGIVDLMTLPQEVATEKRPSWPPITGLLISLFGAALLSGLSVLFIIWKKKKSL